MPLWAISQTSNGSSTQLMTEANRLFESGEYKHAKDKYSDVYLDYGNRDALDKVDVCTECLNLLSKAMSFEREDNYSGAIDNYKSILRLNSKDPNMAGYIANCKKKQYQPMLDNARNLYREGKYLEARDKLREYTCISGQTDEELLISITECITWRNEANDAINNKKYDIAKIYLDKILSYNSTDAISAHRLAEVNSLNQKIKTVFVKEPTKKSLRPFKNKFNYFIYSGFSNPVAFGGGIGFNVSYFQLSLDGGGPMNQEGIEDGFLYEKYIKNCVKINDKTYVQGKMQLAITPGINLKYFGLGVGLGTMMTKELSIEDGFRSGSLSGDESNKTRLLVRPTINGFIPFNSDYTCGLMIMAGYNIVSGVSGLNQFILGIGMFF